MINTAAQEYWVATGFYRGLPQGAEQGRESVNPVEMKLPGFP